MQETDLKITGMSCSHCVSAVERLIKEVEGVKSLTVSLPDNVTIVFDETKTNIEGLKKAINDSEIYKTL